MTSIANLPHRPTLWRGLMWGGATLLLFAPLVAMQFTREVQWTGGDFLIFGIMLALVCGALEIAFRVGRSNAYLAATAVAVGTAFLIIWANLAVGIVGNEDNPINLLYFGVIGIGFIGALLARFQPKGMSRSMLVTAIAQASTAAITLAMGHMTFIIAGVLAAFWMVSSLLYGKAADQGAT